MRAFDFIPINEFLALSVSEPVRIRTILDPLIRLSDLEQVAVATIEGYPQIIVDARCPFEKWSQLVPRLH